MVGQVIGIIFLLCIAVFISVIIAVNPIKK
jgi:hypothetical protein